MSDDLPAAVRHAARVSEEVRLINRAVNGYEAPGDAACVLADLTLALERMPQTLAQLQGWLAAQAVAGLVRHDTAVDVVEALAVGRDAVVTIGGQLERAGAILMIAAEWMRQARDEASHLGGVL